MAAERWADFVFDTKQRWFRLLHAADARILAPIDGAVLGRGPKWFRYVLFGASATYVAILAPLGMWLLPRPFWPLWFLAMAATMFFFYA